MKSGLNNMDLLFHITRNQGAGNLGLVNSAGQQCQGSGSGSLCLSCISVNNTRGLFRSKYPIPTCVMLCVMKRQEERLTFIASLFTIEEKNLCKSLPNDFHLYIVDRIGSHILCKQIISEILLLAYWPGEESHSLNTLLPNLWSKPGLGYQERRGELAKWYPPYFKTI